jgi:hypothetical protein
MRPFNQLEDATEDQDPSADICLFEGQTQARNLDVKAVIADATTLECDALKFTCSIKTVAKTTAR